MLLKSLEGMFGLVWGQASGQFETGTCDWKRLFDIEISDEARAVWVDKRRAPNSETALF